MDDDIWLIYGYSMVNLWIISSKLQYDVYGFSKRHRGVSKILWMLAPQFSGFQLYYPFWGGYIDPSLAASVQ